MRHFWGWLWVCLGLSMVTRAASAKEEEGYLPVHVCVRPPYLNMRVVLWSYYANTTDFIYTLPADYLTKRYKYPTYFYDPEAPPENTKQLPRREDRTLPCDPKPLPPEPPPKEPPKEEAPKQGGSGASGSSGHGGNDKKGEPKERAQSSPKAPPEAPTRASEEEAARHPRLPEHGVTTDWPNAVLPKQQAVLRTRREGEVCSMVLPMRATPASPIARACGNGEGNGDGKGVKKTLADKVAENLAYMAGGINLQFDEDLKRPDGKQYGVMGGRNPKGPNNPFMQAMASGVMIAAAVLSPKADKLFKRLLPSGKKAAPLLMKEMEDVGRGMADELATKLGPQHGGEMQVRRYLADALQQKGAIGPYEVMKQFTDNLEGRWQAHHILEAQWARKFTLGNADKMPAVILTEAEHKKITAILAKRAKKLKIKNTTDLWAAYEEAYVDHPDWLAAIEKYFIIKGK